MKATTTGAKRGPKPGTKRAPKDKAAPKKMAQTTLKAKPATKKRPKPDTEDEDDEDPSLHDDSLLSATPPSAKKRKKGPGPMKMGAKPLREIENEAISEAIDASMMLDGAVDSKPKKAKKATEQYQKVSDQQGRETHSWAKIGCSSLSWNTSLKDQIPMLDQ